MALERCFIASLCGARSSAALVLIEIAVNLLVLPLLRPSQFLTFRPLHLHQGFYMP